MNRVIKLPYKTAFVVNPAGGGGNSGRVWPKIAGLLDRSGEAYRFYMTERPGEGTCLAKEAVRDGAELVVAVGGDGTIREVLNGIDFKKNIFGIIPLGTGNGFRRSCKIPGRWNEALFGLTKWEPRSVDVGVINGSYFLNVVGIGFDAAVAEMASIKYGSVKGYAAYLAAFFDELRFFDHFSIRIETGGVVIREEHTLLAVFANGSRYGGTFAIAPNASIDDGELDLVLVRKLNNPETTILALQVLAKRHLASDAITLLRNSKFKIETDHEVPVHIDGEVIGTLPAEISIRPGFLKILAPPVG